jgi:hypothetical protein
MDYKGSKKRDATMSDGTPRMDTPLLNTLNYTLQEIIRRLNKENDRRI